MNSETRGGITANAEFAAALSRHDLWDARRWWELAAAGTIVRDIRPQRFTARVELPHSPGLPQAVYVKCHGQPSWKERMKCWLRFASLAWGAEGEWRALVDFQAAGIPVAVPVLWGTWEEKSILVTAAIDGCRELHDVVREQGLVGNVSELAVRLARWTRIMHDLGYSHQDYYLCHFLHRVEAGADRLWLMDLHRARRQPRVSLRWRVKDLGQLLFSAREAGIREADLCRFWKEYRRAGSTAASAALRPLITLKANQIARRCARLGPNQDTAAIRRAA